MKILKMGAITLMACSLAGTGWAQAPSPSSNENLTSTEKIALGSVLEERRKLGEKLSAIDADIKHAHPGYHLEWGLETVTLVKDAPTTAPVKPEVRK